MDLRGTACTLALIGALTACSDPRTELVVQIHSEIAELDEVAIEVTIHEGDAAIPRSVLGRTERVEGLASFPLTFGLTSRSHADSLLVIEVTGRAGGRDLVVRQARTRFLPRDSRVLTIVLERACAGRFDCTDRSTCVAGACTDAYQPPSSLPPYRGTLPDAGVGRVDDAGIDAGIDAGGSDGGPIDAGARDAGPGDGGESCEGDGGVVGRPEGCVLDRWPARPACGDTGDDGVARHYGLLDLKLDQGSTWPMIGHDLDGLCTDPLVPGTPTECGLDGGAIAADGRGGIDNSGGALIATGITATFPGYEARTRDSMREGRNVPIVQLRGWSGSRDDARVDAWLAGTIDVVRAEDATPDGGSFDRDAPREDPRWDGTDVAYVASTYFSPDDAPLIRDDNAYVAGGVLVVQLPDRAPIDLPVPGAGVARVRLTDTRLLVRLGPDGGAASALVVGRWAEADMLAYTEDVGLCESDPMFAAAVPVFRGLLARSLDVRSIPGSGGPGVACNAISIGLPFESAARVELGGIVPFENEPAGCP